MGWLGSFARSLMPGNDQQLAADLSAQRRASHRRNIGKTAAKAEAWEDRDRARDRKGGTRTWTWR